MSNNLEWVWNILLLVPKMLSSKQKHTPAWNKTPPALKLLAQSIFNRHLVAGEATPVVAKLGYNN